ncbi:putative HMG-box domain containing protein [Lyophyllum shimeji]|uniref:HMG-box domain containing protein n=1 Tax=Lyophyllum shimeji TaxID=47721 RepID=A0A9P3UW00_LYOSH|nr:putative HMG-box domain containing protein [Lyophyllum shimeji]
MCRCVFIIQFQHFNFLFQCDVASCGLRLTTPLESETGPQGTQARVECLHILLSDWRERIEAENPDAGFDEVGRLLGAKWKALDEEEKKPYIDQAARDKARAEEEKVAYDKGGKKSAASGDDEEEEE